MKHFTITTDEQAEALRPFSTTPKLPLKVGHIIAPSAGVVTRAYWLEYPESDAVTFEQCMAIVKDEVTQDVLRELGEVRTLFSGTISATILDPEYGTHALIQMDVDGEVSLDLDLFGASASIEIPNPTATKIKLLTSILRGQ